MASTNVLSVFVRGVVVDIQCRLDGSVFIAARQEKKQKTAWLRLKKFMADMLYILADRVHPRKYHAPGLEIIQPTALLPSSDCPSPVRHIEELLPIFSHNGDAYYETLLVIEGFKRRDDLFFFYLRDANK